MTQKNISTKSKRNAPPPIVFIALGLVLIGGLYWLKASFSSHQQNLQLPQNRFSLGGNLLITADATPQKQAGVKAFAAGDYQTAIKEFQSSLQKHRNDPETLIYLNNAKFNSNAYKIAVSVPIGSNLNVAQEILRGVAQAQDEINQSGGINKVGLQVEIINDENDPEIARQVATELVKDSQVLAVVGHNTSNASLAAAPVYQQGGLVMITPTSFVNHLSGFGSYIFRTVPTVRLMADPLAHYIVKTAKKTKIAICYDSQAPDNLSFKDEFVASLVSAGGKLVPTICDFSAPTFNTVTAISEAVSSGADGLLVSPHVDRLDKAIELAQANKGRLALFGSPTLYTIKTVQSADVNGLVLPVPWHPKSGSNSIFTTNAKEKWGGIVNWRTATAYDASSAIIAGLRQSQTRDGLQRVLRSPEFSVKGASMDVKFLPSGDRQSKSILVQVQATSSGYDFVPVQP